MSLSKNVNKNLRIRTKNFLWPNERGQEDVTMTNTTYPRSSVTHYVIKIVSYLWQVGGFLHVLWFPPPIKLITTI